MDMVKRIKLIKPNKEEYLKDINKIDSVSWLDQLIWLTNSEYDIIFYREDIDKIVDITKEQMKIALDNLWEMR